jgi:hypothetical protein
LRKFSISQAVLSEAFWNRIFESVEDNTHRQTDFKISLAAQDSLKSFADYNTGSITFCAAWSLYSLTSYFMPSTILEIGTFIGKSTISMALALDHAENPGIIQTCDVSNGFDLNWSGKTKIIQHFKTKSSDMMIGIDCPQDLIFVDGRLNETDLDVMQTDNFENCIFVFDDTEGAEKGAINQILVNQKMQNRIYIYPPSNEVLKKHNLFGGNTLSLSIPNSMVTFSRQG